MDRLTSLKKLSYPDHHQDVQVSEEMKSVNVKGMKIR